MYFRNCVFSRNENHFLFSLIVEERVELADFRTQEWLFPETTANFNKLLIQYRGFCGYTFAVTDGLLLPGIQLEIRVCPPHACSIRLLTYCLYCASFNIVWTQMVN
jgi:hypothetical protein